MRHLLNVKTLSIIGMQKNVGKTTVLNHILKELSDKKIGLTSIGRDGEKEDSVYFVSKPRVYLKKGTIVATTSEAIKNSTSSLKVLYKTNMNTPMGLVHIAEVISDGFTDLAGPSFNQQVKDVLSLIEDEVDIFIVDGAFSRKQIASNHLMEATILVTGASYDKDIKKTVDDTYTIYKLLTLPTINSKRVKDLISNHAVSIIDKFDEVFTFDLESVLGSKEEIVSRLDKTSKYLIINGALTIELVNQLIRKRQKLDELTIIIKDGTKAFLDHDSYINLQKIGVNILVINNINLVCLTYNPYSPLGYEYDDYLFREMLEKKIDLPIYNVLKVRGENCE
ncbi:hypothetical protein KHQ82_01725 [Mycoplasmatota bacterium]|nr:hypothetical protein KHQ82_01725 [Mycoplasmatota bacterium]